MKQVRKAIIPAAGLGTRVLPATKAQAKEMLPIFDKPAMQYLIEELVYSGIEEILIITGRNKASIENHFDHSFELEKTLEEKGKFDLLRMVEEISNMAKIHYVRQKKPLGLGHAIACGAAFAGDEPVAIVLGDDIVYSDVPVIKQMIDKYNEIGGASIIGVQEVDCKDVNKYGIISPGKQIDDKTVEMIDFVEKPDIDKSPSCKACLGRYILEPEVFDYLLEAKPSVGGEIQLTDSILKMIEDNKKVVAYNFDGLRYDIGDKFGLVKATIEYALRDKKIGKEIKDYIKSLSNELID